MILFHGALISQSFQELDILLNADLQDNTQFGTKVAIDGNYAVIGASLADGVEAFSGKVYVYKLEGEEWIFHQSLEASDASGGDAFGTTVAIHNNRIVVGAPREDENAMGEENLFSSGSVYVYQLENDVWMEQQKIVASDRGLFDTFGDAVDIYNDYIFVGVPAEDEDPDGQNTLSGAGSVYIFKLNGAVWEEQQKIVPSDRALSDAFGFSVAAYNNTLVVGARQEDEDENGENTILNAGSAYVFQLEGEVWVEQQKIVASDRVNFAQFGQDVAISDTFILVSSERANSDIGACYVFESDAGIWTESQILTPSDGSPQDRFGNSIDIHNNTIVVGAYFEDEDENGENFLTSAGSAYIFTAEGINWAESQKIVHSQRAQFETFGRSVAISGDVIIVGTPAYDEGQDLTTDGAGMIFGPGCADFALDADLPQPICSGSEATLTASSAAGTISWFDSEDGENSIATGNEFITPELDESTSYWIEAADGECLSDRIEVVVNVNPVPVLDVTEPDPVCEGSTAQLVASVDVGVVNWYLTAEATDIEFTGEEFTTAELSETTSFWVSGLDNDCDSERIEVIVEVIPTPTLDIDPVNVICQGEDVTLSAETSNGVLNWYESETAEVPEFTGVEFTIESVEETISYWVEAADGNCVSERLEVAIDVTPLPNPPNATSPQEIEDEGSTLSDLIVDASGNLLWYADEALTIPLDDSTPLEDGETYYVTQTLDDCESQPTAILVDFTIGLEEYIESQLNIFPNPTSDFLTLESGNFQIQKIEIFNSVGELIFTEEKAENSLRRVDLQGIAAGIYILKIHSESYKYQLRVVKE